MVYNPTTFVNGQAPAVSAEELNKMGMGIRSAHQQIERVGYDLYNTIQEMYYTGNASNSPMPKGSKSVVFDVLKDSTSYNASSTIQFLSKEQGVTCAIGSKSYQQVSASNIYTTTFNHYTTYISKNSAVTGTPADMMDGSNSTSYGWQTGTVPYSEAFAPFQINLGANKLVTGAMASGSYYDTNIANVYFVPYGVTNDTLGTLGLPYNSGSSVEVSFNIAKVLSIGKMQYLNGYLGIDKRDGSSNRFYVNELYIQTGSFNSSIYISKTFELGYTPLSARAFVSVKKETGSSIAPSLNSGGVLTSGVLVGSRPDPYFTGYTEEEYLFDLTGQTSPTEFRITLAPNGLNVPFVKKYGVYFA